MKPWFWRLGVGLSALGALAIAPCLASGSILLSLGLPLSGFTPGLWHDYWQVLDEAAYRPYAARIRLWGGAGLLLAPLLWGGATLALWRQRRSSKPPSPHVPFDDLATSSIELRCPGPGAIPVTTRRGRLLATPDGASILVSAPYYPETHSVIIETLKRSTVAALIIDCGGRTHAYARPTGGRNMLRLRPFGGGNGWNPLAGAWNSQGLDRNELGQLAAVWLPDAGRQDRFIASHARNAFVSLVHVVDDVVRRTNGSAVAVAPGDLYRLCAQRRSYSSPRAFLEALADKVELGTRTRHGLDQWLGLGESGIDTVWKRVTEVFAPFADPVVDMATRGGALPARRCARPRSTWTSPTAGEWRPGR